MTPAKRGKGAIVLTPDGYRKGLMGYVMCDIDKVRDGYAYQVARLVRVSLLVLVAVAGLATGWLFIVGDDPAVAHVRIVPGCSILDGTVQ